MWRVNGARFPLHYLGTRFILLVEHKSFTEVETLYLKSIAEHTCFLLHRIVSRNGFARCGRWAVLRAGREAPDNFERETCDSSHRS